MHDANRLYVGFRAHDPDPQAIRAHLADRDQAWADDWVGVVLDTFNDERRNYLFVGQPSRRADGQHRGRVERRAPRGTASGSRPARITDWGWSAEIEIPFSTLRFQRSDGPQIWGFDAIRGYPRNVAHQMGTFPRDRSNNCYLCQAHKIEGFAGVSPGPQHRDRPDSDRLADRRTGGSSGRADGRTATPISRSASPRAGGSLRTSPSAGPSTPTTRRSRPTPFSSTSTARSRSSSPSCGRSSWRAPITSTPR